MNAERYKAMSANEKAVYQLGRFHAAEEILSAIESGGMDAALKAIKQIGYASKDELAALIAKDGGR